MNKIITSIICLFLFGTSLFAQADPVELCANVIQDGNDVKVDIFVDNFDEMVSYQFGVGWEESKFTLISVENLNDAVPATYNEVKESVPDAITLLRSLWFDDTGITPVTLSDGSLLMTINLQLNDPTDIGIVGVAGSDDFYIEFVNNDLEIVNVIPNGVNCSTLAFSSIVRIDDILIQDFEVSPNPFKDKVTVTTGEILDGSFTVYNASGKLVTQNIPAKGSEINVELPNLTPGAYILKYLSNDNLTQGQIKIFKF